ncbi:MAG: sigma-54 interaction domain-containing protein [Candidatus Binatia bacterium]
MGQAGPANDGREGEPTSQSPDETCKTADSENPLRTLRHWGQVRHQDASLQDLKQRLGLAQLIGESPAFLAAVQKIPAMARCESVVLISGETGTGKEVCARAIHYLSSRASQPFIAVNCGAIPIDLVENELFGHERGAFTSAGGARPGLIAEAEGGTLFLDEIDCLPLLAQVKLLRFLQEKEYRPLGSTKTQKASVRVIAASNADLEEAVQQGKLRRDLYYRINILPLALPSLRQRTEDIPLLACHFLRRFAAEFAKEVTDFSAAACQRLCSYVWPGNVRELEHTIERAVALTQDSIIGEDDIELPTSARAPRQESFQTAKAQAVAEFEQRYIKSLLLVYAGNITKAALAAGKNRRAFWQLMQKHGIVAHGLKDRQVSDQDKS